jgi:hypothetical protein
MSQFMKMDCRVRRGNDGDDRWSSKSSSGDRRQAGEQALDGSEKDKPPVVLGREAAEHAAHATIPG